MRIKALALLAAFFLLAQAAHSAPPKLAIALGFPTQGIDYAALDVTPVLMQPWPPAAIPYPDVIDEVTARKMFPQTSLSILAADIEGARQLPFDAVGAVFARGQAWMQQIPPAVKPLHPGKKLWEYNTVFNWNRGRGRPQMEFIAKIAATGSFGGFDGRGPCCYNILTPETDVPGSNSRASLQQWITDSIEAYNIASAYSDPQWETVAWVGDQYYSAPEIAGTGAQNLATCSPESMTFTIDAAVTAQPDWICYWTAWNQFNGTPCDVNDPRNVQHVLANIMLIRKRAGYPDITPTPTPTAPSIDAPDVYTKGVDGDIALRNPLPGVDFVRLWVQQGNSVVLNAPDDDPSNGFSISRAALTVVPNGPAEIQAVQRVQGVKVGELIRKPITFRAPNTPTPPQPQPEPSGLRGAPTFGLLTPRGGANLPNGGSTWRSLKITGPSGLIAQQGTNVGTLTIDGCDITATGGGLDGTCLYVAPGQRIILSNSRLTCLGGGGANPYGIRCVVGQIDIDHVTIDNHAALRAESGGALGTKEPLRICGLAGQGVARGDIGWSVFKGGTLWLGSGPVDNLGGFEPFTNVRVHDCDVIYTDQIKQEAIVLFDKARNCTFENVDFTIANGKLVFNAGGSGHKAINCRVRPADANGNPTGPYRPLRASDVKAQTQGNITITP